MQGFSPVQTLIGHALTCSIDSVDATRSEIVLSGVTGRTTAG
jgi:hypothetical protein